MDEPCLCSDFDKSARAAGSDEDEQLADVIMNEFKSQSMDPWTDNHYVQLQTPDRFDVKQMQTSGFYRWMKTFLKDCCFCFFPHSQPKSQPRLLRLICPHTCRVPGLQC